MQHAGVTKRAVWRSDEWVSEIDFEVFQVEGWLDGGWSTDELGISVGVGGAEWGRILIGGEGDGSR
jgi:hypothetical protein